MNLVEAVLRQVADDLLALDVPWAVVGGFAVSARAEPRFTRDVDVAVAVTGDLEAEAVVGQLTARGYRLIAMTEQDAAGRLATIRLVPAATSGASDIVVDVLFASSGIEPEIAAAAEAVELVPGLVVPVAQTGHLIALKLLARDDVSRPQDRVDLVALLDAAEEADLDLAVEGVEAIRARGLHHGRDLGVALASLRAGRSTPNET